MCGRFSFASSPKKVAEALGKDIQIMGELQVSYNIAPTQSSYVVTNEQPNLLQSFQWGLIPYWAKNGKNAAKLINARMEEIENKVSFKTPIREQRCLVLVDSFYEWKKLGKQKNAYRILMENEKLMVMAGIWDIWNNEGHLVLQMGSLYYYIIVLSRLICVGKILIMLRHNSGFSNTNQTKNNFFYNSKDFPFVALVKTFSIITTPPNREMAKVHTRMPLILADSEIQQQWLAQASLLDTLSLLKTPADNIVNIYRISNKVNTVKNNSPDLHQQIPEALTLFD